MGKIECIVQPWSRAASGQKSRVGGQGIQYLVSLQWPVVQLDFSDGMHMTENSDTLVTCETDYIGREYWGLLTIYF